MKRKPYKDLTETQRAQRNATARARYAINPEKRRASIAKYEKANPGRKSMYMRAYYQANRTRLLAAIRKRAGLPEATRPCPEHCEVNGCPRGAVCLDHDPITGKFRGWLCRPCNLALTKHHTPPLLRALADYAERPF